MIKVVVTNIDNGNHYGDMQLPFMPVVDTHITGIPKYPHIEHRIKRVIIRYDTENPKNTYVQIKV